MRWMKWRAISARPYCTTAVLASDHPCAGIRMGIRLLNPTDRAQLAQAVRAFTPYVPRNPSGFNTHSVAGRAAALAERVYSPLESLGRVGYVEPIVMRRAGGVVRLEMEVFLTSAARLAWAKEMGCRWDASVCAVAARGGHLEVLKWARAQGCPW